jgi:uncharacterized membrane protein
VSELLLSVFAGGESAAGALRDLQAGRLDADSFASAATVSIAESGSYVVETTGRPGSARGLPGMFWDALFGLILIVPVPGSSYGPSAGALLGALINAGVDERFLARSREALVPGTSALALLLSDGDQDEDLGPLRARRHPHRDLPCARAGSGDRTRIRWDRMSNAHLDAPKRSKPSARHERTPMTEE